MHETHDQNNHTCAGYWVHYGKSYSGNISLLSYIVAEEPTLTFKNSVFAAVSDNTNPVHSHHQCITCLLGDQSLSHMCKPAL